MYERFTDRSRKVMQLANQEAHFLHHQYIRTEHILLGLVKEGSGVAANVLKNLGIDLRKIRLEVENVVPFAATETPVPGHLPHTPRSKKVIDFAIEEARRLKHNYVGTEHLLLGVLREEQGVAAQVLVNLGLDLERLRAEVLDLLGHNLPPVAQAIAAAGPAAPSAPSAPAPVTEEERRAIEERIQRLVTEREVFVAAQNFEDAARCRAELAGLKTLLAWYDWFRRYP